MKISANIRQVQWRVACPNEGCRSTGMIHRCVRCTLASVRLTLPDCLQGCLVPLGEELSPMNDKNKRKK